MMSEVQQIDVESIIKQKWGKTPSSFLCKILEKLICQKEINSLLIKLEGLEGVDFIRALIKELNIKIEVFGIEKLPKDPRAIFVSNHPLGAADGICLSNLIAEHYNTDIRYIVNDILLKIIPLQKIFIPVNVLGVSSRKSIEILQKELNSSLPILSFPAGFCSRFLGGKLKDVPWKKSFIKMAKENDRPIVPIFFQGRNSKLFYTVEFIRRILGVKFNIGMLLLPREFVHSRNKKYKIYIAPSIQTKDLESGLSIQEQIEKIRNIVYSLPNNK